MKHPRKTKIAQIRKLAVTLLADEHGISQEAFSTIREMMMKYEPECKDILTLVRATDDRFYLRQEDVRLIRGF